MKLAFRDVTAGYRSGLRRRRARDRLSVEVYGGQVTALVGPNGAGKTTLLRLASGTLRPWRGQVGAGADTPSGRGGPQRARPRIGFLPDHVELPRAQTLARFLRYGAFLAGLDGRRSEAAVAAAAADAHLVDSLHHPLASFSLGMARRAALAFALLDRPSVLLLDEPWQGLDPISRRLLAQVLRAEAERGTLVVVSSHDLGEVARLAQRVLVLDGGRLVADLRGPVDARVAEAHLRACAP